MGYFEALTSSSFKKDGTGRTVFYRWGVFGKGHVLPDDETEKKLRGFVRLYYMVSLPAIIVVGVAIGWIFAFLLVPVLFVWYHLKSKALIAETMPTDTKLTLKESYKSSAKAHNKKTLWMLLVGSIVLLVGGLFMLIHGSSAYDKTMGVLACLFFGACAVAYAYMLKARRTWPLCGGANKAEIRGKEGH